MTNNISDHFEHEITLVICSEDPDQIAQSVANLKMISGYPLMRMPDQNILDTYFDTNDKQLMRKKLSLRTRRIDDTWKCTMKGKSEPADSGGILRKEIELPWSVDKFKQIIRKLKVYGIILPEQNIGNQLDDPRKIIQSLPLQIIQERKTTRIIRNVVHPDANSGIILAELAIDKTKYKLKKESIFHYEIEIEEKKPGNSKLLKAICDELLAKHDESLLNWKISKLKTGLVLEQLEKEGVMQHLIFNNNYLTLDGYKAIEQIKKQILR